MNLRTDVHNLSTAEVDTFPQAVALTRNLVSDGWYAHPWQHDHARTFRAVIAPDLSRTVIITIRPAV